ncbi:aldo/keto reductase [Nissabacter sp. SGAir0207]|uniref:aldo/keto reductase n=1 Tax=Nissabacter sp. SGAir0207 TaxID=2126321 RepID=UPI0010CCEF5C|nr:aldo/keto reductase [Nissabacter sp. SGAir0207]QCR35861.1 oxidoreductase [Nissabacter sp. SGAir0207]
MVTQAPFIKLNNGVEMPALGLGVYLSSPQETVSAVASAIQSGYSLIDTAKAYHNEAQVGEALAESDVPRADMFITTKLFNGDYGFESTLKAFDESLKKLKLDYLDLYLLHWPTKNWEATLHSYKALEKLYAEGRVRAIGVCNFMEDQLEALISQADVVPAVNQVELHPYFAQKSLVAFNKAHDITTEAWSPIGGVKNYGNWNNYGGSKDPLNESAVTAIARAKDKSPAQVILRWHYQNGIVAIPKSVNAGRIAENINVFDFSLSQSEMLQLDHLDAGLRAGPHPKDVDTTSFSELA